MVRRCCPNGSFQSSPSAERECNHEDLGCSCKFNIYIIGKNISSEAYHTDMVNRDNQSLEECGIAIAEEPMLSCGWNELKSPMNFKLTHATSYVVDAADVWG